MDGTVVAALIGLAGSVFGVLGKMGYDKVNNGRHYGSNGGNGNGSSIDRAISQRAEVEFQTRMTLLMTQLTAAIEKGHDKALDQMLMVSQAITESAAAIKQVHDEIVAHREQLRPAIGVVFDTKRTVQEIQRTLERQPQIRTTGNDK